MERTRGYLLIALASIILGTISIFGKLALQYEISPETLTALRFFLSFLILLICILMFRKELLRIDRKDFPLFLIFGVLGTAAQRIAYFYTLDFTTPTMAIILFFNYPIFVTVYAALFQKERITSTTVIAIIFALSGVALVVKVYEISQLILNIPGIVLGIVTSLLFALYFILTKRIRNFYTNWTLILYGDGIGGLTLCFFAISRSSEIMRYPSTLWVLIFAITCTSLLGYLLYSYALKYVESSKGSILSVTEPLAIVFMSALILKERIELLQLAGIILALAGIAFLFYKYEK